MPTVLITGTSTGFGHLTTELLAARGWHVFATMRDLTRKDSLERALKDAGLSERVTFLQLDITHPASIEAAVSPSWLRPATRSTPWCTMPVSRLPGCSRTLQMPTSGA